MRGGCGGTPAWRAAGWVGAAAAVLGLSPAETLAQACAMCRTAIQSPDDPLARGINLSVMLMVTAPFAVVGSIGGWLAYTYRRARTAGSAGTHGTIDGQTEEPT